MDGVINVAKPRGITSHGVVARVRRAARQRRVGHAGTLDPRAEGVLVLLLGRATRLAEYLLGGGKVYRFSLVFGIETDTLDLDGSVVREASADGVTPAALDAACRSLIGCRLMAPPAYSAIKQGGRKLYELARAGMTVDVAPRPTRITALSVDRVFEEDGRPAAEFVLECESGTYVRSVGREIASACGAVASVDLLVRECSGAFRLSEAWPLDEIEALAEQGRMAEVVLDMRQAAGSLPSYQVTPEQALRLARGNQIGVVDAALPEAEPIAVLAEDGVLVAIAEYLAKGGAPVLRPMKVLTTPTECGSPG